MSGVAFPKGESRSSVASQSKSFATTSNDSTQTLELHLLMQLFFFKRPYFCNQATRKNIYAC